MNLTKIQAEIQNLSFWLDGSGAYMAIAACQFPEQISKSPAIMEAIAELEKETGKKAVYVMVNRVPAGVTVPIHTDTLLNNEKLDRYHLPIQTNRNAMWWDEEDEWIHFPVGVWWGPVKYWINHQVKNLGDKERIHLVVDLR